MNDQPPHVRPMTSRQLRAVVHHIALAYLEVERGLRSPRQLASFLTRDEYRRHRLTKAGRRTDASPVHPHDIGRVRIDKTTPKRINASVPVRRGEDSWSNLIVDLRSTSHGWQVEKLDRLERLLPREPRQVDIDEHARQRRAWLIDDERRLVAAAHQALEGRYDRSEDKRTWSAREVRRQRDGWARLLKETEAEAATLDQHATNGQPAEASIKQAPPPRAVEDEASLEAIIGPRPDDEDRAKRWDEAVRDVETYQSRWGADEREGLLHAGATTEQEADRRRLLARLGSVVRELEVPPTRSPHQELDATARSVAQRTTDIP